MNDTTRNWLRAQHRRQSDYAAQLHANAPDSPQAATLLPHALSSAHALHDLTLCEYAAFPEVRFANRQAAAHTRRASSFPDGSTEHRYLSLIADLFTEAAHRISAGDIGVPLETEEGEETDEPLFVPEVFPARPEPVPA